ncbi:MAG TPA: tRNA (adenosine(37)-N6)-threonylcarbamoyltransferase complex dimerization subunit type 1 TsaB [Stellaceae bacterium]
MIRTSRPVVLALDSAGSACSAAVGLGDTLLASERIEAIHGQAEALLPLVDRVMRRAGQVPAAIGLVVVTVGPGSFTGIRVGLAAANGIALATGARRIGVTSFEAVAVEDASSNCAEDHSLLIAVESRREDLYVQFFDLRRNPLGEPAAILPSALGAAVDATVGGVPLLIAGDAAQRAGAALAKRPATAILKDSAPDAVGALRAGLRLLRLGEPADVSRPLYLRPPEVTFLNGSRKQSPARS